MKCVLSILLAAALAAAGLPLAPPQASAADNAVPVRKVAGKIVQLGLNKSVIIDFDDDVRDVLVSSPAVADAVVRTNRKIYLIGVAIGETNVFVFGEGNRQIAQFEIVVGRDTAALQATLSDLIPGSKIVARAVGESIVLSGTVPSPEGAAKAADIAAQLIGGPDKIVNMIQIAGSDQVNLRVVIAEVQRNVAKQLGVDFAIQTSNGSVTVNTLSEGTFGVAGKSLADTGVSIGWGDNYANIRALEQNNILKTLAEPNLTAVSGEDANFLVGGEVPTILGYEDGTYTYGFKPYGVGLSFTPVVLSPGLISLRIKTEISELDNSTALSLGNQNGLAIQGFKTRRAETTVELPSGGSIVLGGLVKDDVRQSLNGTPGLMDLPILGALFKSRDFQRQQTELVIFVTPYIVDPVATSALARPDQNLSFAPDAQGYFLNQVNRIYRSQGSVPGGSYQGRVGFVYE